VKILVVKHVMRMIEFAVGLPDDEGNTIPYFFEL